LIQSNLVKLAVVSNTVSADVLCGHYGNWLTLIQADLLFIFMHTTVGVDIFGPTTVQKF